MMAVNRKSFYLGIRSLSTIQYGDLRITSRKKRRLSQTGEEGWRNPAKD
jgi:hypothetical protein